MQLKSLLLASGAVLIAGAGSGALAADVLPAEPEPIEYVRVCDAYGAGWFYLPGTETCLKIDGDVRVIYTSTHFHDADDSSSSHDAGYRGRVNIRASNDTEYGTLGSRIRFFGETSGDHSDVFSSAEGPASTPVVIDRAVITLGGFRVGFDESMWHRLGDYGYYEAEQDGLYVEHLGLLLDYTYQANGWTVTGGVTDGGVTGTAGQPDIYGGVAYEADVLRVAGLVYYDSSTSSQAWKLRADWDLSSVVAGGSLGFFYMDDQGETDYVKGHIWGVTAMANLSENLILFAGYSDYSDMYAGTVGAVSASATNWTAGLGWDVVEGLRLQAEYSVTVFDEESVADDQFNNGTLLLKVERSF